MTPDNLRGRIGWPPLAPVIVLLVLLALIFAHPCHAQDGPLVAVNAPWLGWQAPQVPTSAAHGRFTIESHGWDGSAYRVVGSTGAAPLSRVSTYLWCSGRRAGDAVVGPYREILGPGRLSRLQLAVEPEPGFGAPCVAGTFWRLATGAVAGYLWTVDECPLAGDIEKSTVARRDTYPPPVTFAPPMNLAATSWVPAPPFTGQSQLGWLPETLGHNWFWGPSMDQCAIGIGCSLPGSTVTNSQPCPGESRATVPASEWCSALRRLSPEAGCSQASVASALFSACGRFGL